MAFPDDKSFLLEPLDYNKALRYSGHVELEKLIITSRAVTVFLNDADYKQTVYPAVKNWVENLRDAAYDWEDLLDEIAIDDAQAQKKSVSGEEDTKGLIKKKINLIVGKMEQLVKEASFLGLTESTESQTLEHPVTSSLIDESIVCGRKNDTEAIIELLLSRGDDGISVIPIVGMAGLGKTTLAQLAFNHPKVQSKFELRAWVSVGFHFDICKVTRKILEAVTLNKSESSDLNLLQVRLKESLMRKKFLLVLDDVWNQDYGEWMIFQTPLTYGAPGSKIIVTTHRSGVAQVVSTKPAYHLGFLNDEDCWFVLSKHAFGNESPKSYPHLEAIGKKIARICSGLPSVAYALGSLLRSKRSVTEWEAILKKNILFGAASSPLSAVKLSYYHLPTHLRRCFHYCSIFPRGYEFDKEKLILQWMAEGFVQQISDERKEDTSERYFQELLSSSFFQKSGANFPMHDLIAELARLLAGNHCFRLEVGQKLPYAISGKLRHLSFARGESDSSKKYLSIFEATSLTTFLPINWPTVNHEYFHLDNLVEDLLVRLPLLRVLSLAFYDITTLPSSLGKLKHLRYLDLSHTPLEILPKSICNLYNLQTLNLSYCRFLITLPEGMVKLINLRHLFMKGTDVERMPFGFGRLKNLQTLSNFVVGRKGARINELSGLFNLRALSISGLQNLDTSIDDGILTGMKFLEKLELEWSSKSDDSEQEIVLQNLVPPDDLKRLVIESYGANTFPKWLGGSSLSQIVSLRLSNCVNCSYLPTLGELPSLEVLEIEGLNQVRSIDQEFYGMSSYFNTPFQSLKILKFDRMLNWEEWRTFEGEDGEFPCLLELYITNCPRLMMSLPKRLPSLLKLVISECPKLSYSDCLPETSAKCNVLIDGKKVQPRISEPEDMSPVSPHQSDSNEDDVAPESSNRMTATSEVTQLSEDEMQLQDSSPRTWKVSDIEQFGELPKGLQILRIEGCDTLYSLPPEIFSDHPFLQRLYVVDCGSLLSFASGAVLKAPALKTLHIRNCRKLVYIELQFPLLEHLCIESSCDSLESFSLDDIPELRILCLADCINLQSLEIYEEASDYKHDSLESLEIRDCPKLGQKSFPRGLPASNLSSIVFSNCKSLQSLPIQQGCLQSLRSLFISKCPLLESLALDGLPTSLNLLCISSCDKISITEGLKLNQLQALQHFEIEGGCVNMTSFPSQGLLPKNLVSLHISKLMDLKSLDQEALKELMCLEKLKISCCRKLRSFPKKLPPSLSTLSIKECPLLKSKLQKDRGSDWRIIAYIPNIYID